MSDLDFYIKCYDNGYSDCIIQTPNDQNTVIVQSIHPRLSWRELGDMVSLSAKTILVLYWSRLDAIINMWFNAESGKHTNIP